MDEPEGEKEADDGNDEFAQATDVIVEEGFYVAADKTLREEGDAHGAAENIFGEINGDGVHTHPNERLAPAAELEDIDDPKENPEQDRTVAAGDEDEGGGPDFFG